ncbi:MAG: 5-formyltetrahydrofolate cyclo-ligase [Chromatiales bacterium]|nr:5-formyltetrahydrofolate cyclo-ligase [Chromatiales bacterium]
MPTDLPNGHQAGETKPDLRRQIRADRRALAPGTARAAANRAIHRLWSLPCLSRARSLAVYLPTAGELDCTPLAVQAWRRGRQVFLPVITGGTLRFAPFHSRSELRGNRFGIPEPVTLRRHWRTARQLDVIVAPLVAFDVHGHRLGMGGGFYDRTLAFLTRSSRGRRPHFIALAFEMQKLAELPSDAWDVRLDAVVTESATYRFA